MTMPDRRIISALWAGVNSSSGEAIIWNKIVPDAKTQMDHSSEAYIRKSGFRGGEEEEEDAHTKL